MADVSMLDNDSTKKKSKRTRKKKEKKIVDTEAIKEPVFPFMCNKSVVGYTPVISKDSKYIICGCGKLITVFRRKTGILENTFRGHKREVNNILINEKDPTQVISMSCRELLIWDYVDLSIFKKYIFTIDLIKCFINPRSLETLFCKTRQPESKRRSKKELLVAYNIQDGKVTTNIGPVSTNDKSVVISANGNYVAYTYKQKLSIYSVVDASSNSHEFDESKLTCVSFHPTQVSVATGDEKGTIIIWYNLLGNKKVVCTKMHWHHSPVADLFFTNDASYLMSGGQEGVLVIWQLETQIKSFVPRVGGAIKHMVQSSDSQFITLSIDSNMIKILSAHNNSLSKAIKFLAPADEVFAGLCYNPQMDCVVLNGRPDGVIQFYQPENDVVKLNLDVVGENVISSVKERYVYPTRVERIALTYDGMWMATLEIREDRYLPTERKLKFWKCSENDKSYSLNTLVDPPHDDDVYSLLFQPLNETSLFTYMLVTTSKDGRVKTWVFQEETNNKGETIEVWQIHSIGDYCTESCKEACFSQDGSLLAVLFSEITLWDPELLQFQTSLSWNLPEDNIKSITFGHNESSHYLIGHSSNYLVVWNINTCLLEWQLDAEVSLLVSDPYSRYFAAFICFQDEQKLHLYLFDPSSPTPIDMLYNVQQSNSTITSAIFTPRKSESVGKTIWSQIGNFYFLTDKTVLYTLLGKGDEDIQKEVPKKEEPKDSSSVFENIFGVLPKGKLPLTDEKHRLPVGNPSSAVIRKMMSTPTHVLPPVHVLCKAFLKSLLIPKDQNSENHDNEDEEDAMETSDTDEVDNSDVKKEIEEIGSAETNVVEMTLIKLPLYDFNFIENTY